SRYAQSRLFQLGQQVVVDLVAMAVALDNNILAVGLTGLAALDKRTFLRAQAHGAAQIGAFVPCLGLAGGGLPLGDQADHGMLAGLVELGGVGVLPAQHIAGDRKSVVYGQIVGLCSRHVIHT